MITFTILLLALFLLGAGAALWSAVHDDRPARPPRSHQADDRFGPPAALGH
jgi:hypothetical protein